MHKDDLGPGQLPLVKPFGKKYIVEPSERS
jgi:hypothetical protein